MIAVLALGGCAPATRPTVPPSAPIADGPPGWAETVAAARQEGQLTLSGPPGPLWREALIAFEREYPGISVQYTGRSGHDFWPRLYQERAAGQYVWDVRVGGPGPQVFQARDAGLLNSVRPLLVLPEVADAALWAGGFDGLYADKEKEYVPAFVARAEAVAYVNRALVPEADLAWDSQLRDPRWRGKIAVAALDHGSGLDALTTLLVAFGEDYLRDLLTEQHPVVAGDSRQLAEWVIRGRYPIGIGIASEDLRAFERQGLAFDVQGVPPARQLVLGHGAIQLLSRAPHPNAAKLFVNWLLTRATQGRLAATLGLNSRRLDVPPGAPDQTVAPSRLGEYVPQAYESLLGQRERAWQLGERLLVK
jgi:iron(III) transport system substrate-binding protein